MTKKELIEQLSQYEDDSMIWFRFEPKGEVIPEEITIPINNTELTADGILLSNSSS